MEKLHWLRLCCSFFDIGKFPATPGRGINKGGDQSGESKKGME